MGIKKTLLPTFAAIAAGSVATVDMPRNRRVRAIHLELGDGGLSSAGMEADPEGALAALAGNIVVKLNGHANRTHSAAQLSQMNGVNGVRWSAKGRGTPGTAAYRALVSIFFAEPWRKDLGESDLLAWNIDRTIESFTVEVAINAGIVTPTIGGVFEWEELGGRVFGPVVKVFQNSFGASGTTQDLVFPVKDGFLQAVHFFPTTGGQFVDRVKFTVDGEELQDTITNAQNASLLQQHDLDPDTGTVPRFDLVLDHTDRLNDALNLDAATNVALQVAYNAAASGTLPALIVVGGKAE